VYPPLLPSCASPPLFFYIILPIFISVQKYPFDPTSPNKYDLFYREFFCDKIGLVYN